MNFAGIFATLGLFLLAGLSARAGSAPPDPALLHRGFDAMYNLSFPEAHSDFKAWQRAHPEDPEGPVFDAAAYLFSEFDRLHILQSEFFVDDDSFKKLPRRQPDPKLKQQFEAALANSRKLSDQRLASDPNDSEAQFAKLLQLGLHADYLALIQKQELSALGEIKQATAIAENLVQQNPSESDAYIAIGIENYLLSLKPAPMRWFLRLDGAQTSQQTGIEKLRITAESGRFLKPYAQLLLAIAALRNGDKMQAARLLSDLAGHFPRNALYSQELQKLK